MLRHYLQWHIIHSCNLKCTHCYQDDYGAKMLFEEMLPVLDKYEKYLQLNGYEGQINLTGGEPLLHPDFFKAAGEIKRRGIRLGILTNGVLINQETAERISKLKPVFVQVSLDGTKDIHDEIRGEGNFEKALKGIDELKKTGTRVLVSFTAMKSNYRDFSDVARICQNHKVDKLWWDRVVSDDEKVYLSTEEFKEISASAVKLKRKYSFISNDRALQGLHINKCGYECSAGKRLLIILANGDMMACRRLPFIIGNINQVEDIEAFLAQNKKIREIVNASEVPECKGCQYYVKCRGGAKCVTYARAGRLGIRDVNCWL